VVGLGISSIQTPYNISKVNFIITFWRMFLMYMGQLPPAGLSLVVILKPRPDTPLVSSNSILRPIFLVLAVCKLVAALRGAGETFLVGDTVAIFVLIFSAVIMYINVMKHQHIKIPHNILLKYMGNMTSTLNVTACIYSQAGVLTTCITNNVH
jgi:hypothetical protein